MKRPLFFFAALAAVLGTVAQEVKISVDASNAAWRINKEIYGQFAEHLGTCIYGGLWVGPNSTIANTDGYRNDVLKALQELEIPVLRWPGGCFADEYHWMDGIGPYSERPALRNNNWGGTVEDNSFGTHEFLNLCELLGCEPYISGNVGSGTVEELAKWVEYMTSNEDTPMANLRRQNGREEAWKVKYLGVGNESWGCGGNMRPEYYSDLYRRYSLYCRDVSGNHLYKIASGASDYDYNWTKVLMGSANLMNGLSLHYYTVRDWNHKGSATRFSAEEYYWTLGKCLEIEQVVARHSQIMDERDPQKRVGLMVDEWGTWWDEEPGTISGHLYQQNTMRDAMVAALTLSVFHRHADRVRMANIAQVVNVLQSMILTDTEGEGHMVLTPTYHVFRMFRPFQDATYLPCTIETDSMEVGSGRVIPVVEASTARATDGSIVVALINTNLDEEREVAVSLDGADVSTLEGSVLTCSDIADFNDFDHPDVITPAEFSGAKLKKGEFRATLPAKSIVVVTLR